MKKQPVVITICVGSSCHLRGAPELIRRCTDFIAKHKLEHRVSLKGTFCISRCGEGMNFRIGRGKVLTARSVEEAMTTDYRSPLARREGGLTWESLPLTSAIAATATAASAPAR